MSERARSLIEAAPQAVYDEDDFDYNDYTSAIEHPFPAGKPYLENDYDRYEGMARAAAIAVLETLAAGASADVQRELRRLASEVAQPGT